MREITSIAFVILAAMSLVVCIEGCGSPDVQNSYMQTTAKIYNGRYSPGDVLSFQCHEGYKMTGAARIVCQFRGRWSRSPPKCIQEGQTCVAPKHNDYQHEEYSKMRYDVGETIEYKCRFGYYVPSTRYMTSTCMSNGKWNNRPYKCQRYCVNPKIFFGGDFYPDKPNYKYGEKVYYACPGQHSRYVYSTCSITGVWKQARRTSTDRCFDYCKMPDMEYGSYEPKMDKYRQGAKIKYSCEEGYYMSYVRGSRKSNTATCQSSGMWDMRKPMCKKYCMPPDYRMHNHRPYRKTKYLPGENIYYYCMEGFLKPKTYTYRQARCMSNGMWNTKPYKCERYCMIFDHTNFYHKPYAKLRYKPGERMMMYECMDGYHKKSDKPYDMPLCESDGKWDMPPYHCLKYCDAPMIKHGSSLPTKTKYKYMEKVTYQCEDGYTMQHKAEIYEENTCDKYGKWKHMTPMCKKYCMKPMIKNGRSVPEMEKYNIGDRVSYKCDEGYMAKYSGAWIYESNLCMETGKWEHMSVTCEIDNSGKCQPLQISNGSYMPAKKYYEVMDKVSFKCNDGYGIFFEKDWFELATCMTGGKWDFDPPKCRPDDMKFCKAPMIMHGSYEPMNKMYSKDDRVYFKCDGGYQLYFPEDWFEFVTCQSDGNWDFKPPKCRSMSKSYCNPPEFINGMYMPAMKMYEEGDRLYFKCTTGYQIFYGKDWFEFSTCRNDGKWDFKPPMCRRSVSDDEKFCYGQEIIHGMMQPQKYMYDIGDTVKYKCKNDYMIHYEDEEPFSYDECKPDGTWKHTAPKCISKLQNYCYPPGMMYGSYMPAMKMYKPGDRLRYKCKKGYDLYYDDDGFEYSTCMKNGKWDKEPLKCTDSQKMYCQKQMIENGFYKPVMKMYLPKDKLHYKCNTGFMLYFEKDWFEFATCKDNGLWDFEPPKCIKAEMDYCSPPRIDNGFQMPMKSQYAIGDKVKYSCKMGYRLFYEFDWYEFSTCKPGGHWEFKPPLCKDTRIKYCSPPEHPNGYFKPFKRMYEEGDRVYIMCNIAFKKQFYDESRFECVTCLNGKWDKKIPKCVRRDTNYCKPQAILHGMYEPQMKVFSEGDRVWYKCEDGYMKVEDDDDHDPDEEDHEHGHDHDDDDDDHEHGHDHDDDDDHEHGHDDDDHGHGHDHDDDDHSHDKGSHHSHDEDDDHEHEHDHDDDDHSHGMKDHKHGPNDDDHEHGHDHDDDNHSHDKGSHHSHDDDDHEHGHDHDDDDHSHGMKGHQHGHDDADHEHGHDHDDDDPSHGKKGHQHGHDDDAHKHGHDDDDEDHSHDKESHHHDDDDDDDHEHGHVNNDHHEHHRDYGTCLKNGQWDRKPPKCIRRNMDYCLPPDFDHGRYSPMKKRYYPGDTLVYYCDRGHIILYRGEKYSKAQCLSSGKWDQMPPMCMHEKKPYCKSPIIMNSEMLKPDKKYYMIGDRLYVKCKSGFYKKYSGYNQMYSTCGNGGKWDMIPMCVELPKKLCKSPKHNVYLHKCYSKMYYMPGDWIKYECDHGYYDSSGSMPKYAICKSDGTFTVMPKKCTKYCMVDDMRYRYHTPMKKYYKPGEKISYSCNDGFYMKYEGMSRSNEAKCLPGGMWDREAPKCMRNCYAPTTYFNGQYFPKKYAFNHGESIYFMCYPGYQIISTKSSVTCGHYGKWDDYIPMCYGMRVMDMSQMGDR
ncbi:complement receptor type 2-like isoform X2 [Styela clava]